MRQWIDSFQESEQSASLLGGKGLNLFRLQSLGMRTAPFGVVSTLAYEDYLANGRQLRPALIASILETVRGWQTDFVAVRSSMSSEDGASKSYAGMMESFLYVKLADIPEKIIACFESMHAARVQIYEKSASGSEPSGQKAAVVIQKMVHSAVSGVAFSRAPIGDSALLLIDAGIGLGEGIVSGQVETDAYWVDRFYKIVRRDVRLKSKALRRHPAGGLAETLLDPSEGSAPALSEAQILQLGRALLQLEAALGYPIDIEWGFEKSGNAESSELYFLQVRPITQKFEELRYYIDTNLSESYPGITSPLTASFVTIGYREVFLAGTKWLGLDTERLLRTYPKLRILVKSIAGHMYYDLSSYYVMLGTVPNGKKNIENWHRMIGGAMIEGFSFDHIQEPPTREALNFRFNMIRLLLRHDAIFKDFYKTAAEDRQRMLKELAAAESSLAIAKFLDRALEKAGFFGLTALNDTLIMRLTKAMLNLLDAYQLPHTILPALFKTKEGVASLRPMEEIREILGEIPDVDHFLEIFAAFVHETAGDEWEGEQLYAELYQRLAAAGYEQGARRLEAYVAAYGQRSFEELKIESLTVKQAPKLLLEILKMMAQDKQRGARSSMRQSQEPVAEKLKVFGNVDRLKYKLLSSLMHKTIKTREQTRLIRGEYFGVVRDAVMNFFMALRRERPELFGGYRIIDFFGLSLPSIFAYARGELDAAAIAAEIQANLGHHEIQAEHPSWLCAAENETKLYFLDENFQGRTVPQLGSARELSGQGASEGIVEGIVLRLEDPKEAFGVADLSSCILVTRTTDPAWVFIMAQCCGLISEKGSLLSHTAIIGREMGIPTVVAADGAMSQLKTGMRIRINGAQGSIELLD